MAAQQYESSNPEEYLDCEESSVHSTTSCDINENADIQGECKSPILYAKELGVYLVCPSRTRVPRFQKGES